MRNLRVSKRGDDLPMVGIVKRVRKGVYVVTLKYVKTNRHYNDEIVSANNVKKARESVTKMFPTIKWKGVKVKLPKVKLPKVKPPKVPKVRKVTKVRKPKKAKKK